MGGGGGGRPPGGRDRRRESRTDRSGADGRGGKTFIGADGGRRPLGAHDSRVPQKSYGRTSADGGRRPLGAHDSRVPQKSNGRTSADGSRRPLGAEGRPLRDGVRIYPAAGKGPPGHPGLTGNGYPEPRRIGVPLRGGG